VPREFDAICPYIIAQAGIKLFERAPIQ